MQTNKGKNITYSLCCFIKKSIKSGGTSMPCNCMGLRVLMPEGGCGLHVVIHSITGKAHSELDPTGFKTEDDVKAVSIEEEEVSVVLEVLRIL
jgi:hypothetical protein